jgi:Arc/MetJ-type ribon-helix-helix transcriptional regulator
MNLNRLPADLEQFIQQELASGRYVSEDALVVEALQLLREHASLQEVFAQDRGAPAEVAPRASDDYVRAISRALETGVPVLAENLAKEGAERYPEHAELQKYARVLAPPKVMSRPASASATLKANNAWLRTYRHAYMGQWIALRDGELVQVADSFDALVEALDDTTGLLLTHIIQ